MDIFAHGLWTAAAAIGAKRKLGAPIRPGWTAWWGVFPDLFAFTIPVTAMVWHRVTTGGGPERIFHHPVAWQLYQISHSLIVFLAVFGLVWLIARRPQLALLGWALHILIDIPTHTSHFATPFLWPLSPYRFSGISWGNRWFMLSNYTALALVYLTIWITSRQARPAEAGAD